MLITKYKFVYNIRCETFKNNSKSGSISYFTMYVSIIQQNDIKL